MTQWLRPGFNSQHLRDGSQPSVTVVPPDAMPSSGLHRK